ncbi:MAG TPA: type I 3-dehydroquinate dehydratase [Elusimicrobiota bacterium]|nr:type I 3-dehydroquinate dehydratase [Elusimicrobiota bacterium]
MNPRQKFIGELNRRGVVVVPLSEPASLLRDAQRAFRGGAGALEVRADYFTVARLKGLRGLLERLRKRTRLPVILTLRRAGEGGKRLILDRRRMELFCESLPFVDGLDVEIRPESFSRVMVRRAHAQGRFVILSSHDFKRTPSDSALRHLADRFRALGGDLFKVAAHAASGKDVDRLIRFLNSCRIRHQTVIPMGARWRTERIGAFRNGSCLAYGHLGRPTAPGQTSLRDLVSALSGKE